MDPGLKDLCWRVGALHGSHVVYVRASDAALPLLNERKPDGRLPVPVVSGKRTMPNARIYSCWNSLSMSNLRHCVCCGC